MFKISPVQNDDLAKEYTSLCNTTVNCGAFIYAMTDIETGALMGISQFEITDVGGYIYDLLPKDNYDDFEAMFILGRQTMNFIDTCGAHICYADIKAGDEKLIKAIGFSLAGDKYFCDMTGFFDGSHCSGHKS